MSIGERIKNISGDQRVLYYNEVNKRIKDPDTYATLNYFFIVGVHHFYLGKWIRGSLNIYFCGIGIYFIFSPGTENNTEGLAVVGVLIVVMITLMETYSLFRSQSVVKMASPLALCYVPWSLVKDIPSAPCSPTKA